MAVGVKFPQRAVDVVGMTRETTFWHHYLTHHAGHSVLSFSTSAAIGALTCLCLLACWTTAQVVTRCGRCEAIPVRCHCAQQ